MKHPDRKGGRSKVRAVVYHMPGGESFAIPVDSSTPLIEFGLGRILDTSEIDGLIHYFPRGNA